MGRTYLIIATLALGSLVLASFALGSLAVGGSALAEAGAGGEVGIRLRRDKEQVRAKSSALPEPAIPPRRYRQKSFTFRTRAPIRPRHSHLGGLSAITGSEKIRRDWSLTARRFAGASTRSHALGTGRETHAARWSREGVCCSRSDYRATINELACQGRGLHPSSKFLRRGSR
jgi:hypothetical protein